MMKKIVAMLLVGASGTYLATLGIAPDLIPFVDEGIAFVVLINSLAMLGLDLRKFVGIKTPKKKSDSRPIDVD